MQKVRNYSTIVAEKAKKNEPGYPGHPGLLSTKRLTACARESRLQRPANRGTRGTLQPRVGGGLDRRANGRLRTLRIRGPGDLRRVGFAAFAFP